MCTEPELSVCVCSALYAVRICKSRLQFPSKFICEHRDSEFAIVNCVQSVTTNRDETLGALLAVNSYFVTSTHSLQFSFFLMQQTDLVHRLLE